MSGTAQPLMQRRIGLRFRFSAGENSLKYSARDYSGERTVDIPYEAINLSQPAYVTLTATPLLRRLFGGALLLLLMAAAVGAFDRDLAIIWLFVALPFFVAAIVGKLTGWSNIELKLFDLQPLPPGARGPMRVIDDSRGDEIIAIIKEARKTKLRRLYGEANLAADASVEVARITWLRDEDIISDAEWKLEVDKINSAQEESESDQKTDSIH